MLLILFGDLHAHAFCCTNQPRRHQRVQNPKYLSALNALGAHTFPDSLRSWQSLSFINLSIGYNSFACTGNGNGGFQASQHYRPCFKCGGKRSAPLLHFLNFALCEPSSSFICTVQKIATRQNCPRPFNICSATALLSDEIAWLSVTIGTCVG